MGPLMKRGYFSLNLFIYLFFRYYIPPPKKIITKNKKPQNKTKLQNQNPKRQLKEFGNDLFGLFLVKFHYWGGGGDKEWILPK